MHYVFTTSWEDGIANLTERLVRELRGGQRVLWIVSGGSNVRASVEIMDSIAADLTSSLSVMLGDERYGPTGHADSNWQQLIDAGFDAKQATVYPVLKAEGFEATAKRFETEVKDAFGAAEVIIAQLGIGEDGHIAGILPGSPVASETTTALVAAYEGEDYQRITLTPAALKHISAAYVFAFGGGKREALTQLRRKRLSVEQQPAQLLKQLRSVYIYNDQIGG
jgi:6-phosphogluconolactonase/glucosamine-6-phosphate isomerase/deaminase